MTNWISVVGALQQTFTMATPLLIAALGENIVQKSGVVNVGLEGMMLCGAFGATLTTLWTGNPLIGVLAGCAVGALAGLIFALFAVKMAANQVVVGVVVNLFALGMTGTIYRAIFGKQGTALQTHSLNHLFFEQTILFPFAILLVPALWFWLNRSRAGLELRACGERPLSAEASGVDVMKFKTLAILFGGGMAGIAGAFLSIGGSNTFVPNMTDGRGFIALAIVTAGRWNPVGCLVAALIFGFADALQYQGQALGINVPKDLLLASPYLATLLFLAFGAKRTAGPESLGKPYLKS